VVGVMVAAMMLAISGEGDGRLMLADGTERRTPPQNRFAVLALPQGEGSAFYSESSGQSDA
jgi:hypothetical protein